ncbi:hypothetical protein PMI14_04427 [Acidovorax sp. CF316]|nr:hypothetical protein PMI14_04427 [Acidovorax sp. CF316]
MVDEQQALDSLDAAQLREVAARLLTQLRHTQALNEKLAHENALLKRMKFAAQSERYSPEQRSLLDEELNADLAAVAHEIAEFDTQVPAQGNKAQPKRQHLPANLPRREIHHEPASVCTCGC